MPAGNAGFRPSNALGLRGFPPRLRRSAGRRWCRNGRWRTHLIRFLATVGVALAGWLAEAGIAAAGFQVCNQTLDVVNVAIGSQRGEVFRTEGWWTIGSNQCANVIQNDLQYRYIFVYATDVFGQELLDGTEPMCVAAEKFTIDGTEECWMRSYRQAKFLEVDTHDQANWTLFLTAPEAD